MPVNQGIGGDALLGHGIPQRFITNHIHAPFYKAALIIFVKKGVYYTEKSIYNGCEVMRYGQQTERPVYDSGKGRRTG